MEYYPGFSVPPKRKYTRKKMSDSVQKGEELEEAKSYSGLGIESTWIQSTTREQDKVYFEEKPIKYYLVNKYDKNWVKLDRFISQRSNWNATDQESNNFTVDEIELK